MRLLKQYNSIFMTSKEKDYWNILDAIEKNDLDRMVSHIRKSNFDINRESTYYMPLLACAMRTSEQNPAIIDWLLENGAQNYDAALHIAVAKGDTKNVQKMLQKGADVNLNHFRPDEKKISLLDVFLMRPLGYNEQLQTYALDPEKPLSTFQALVDAGIELNPKESNLVARAYQNRSPNYAKTLIQKGARVDGERSYEILRNIFLCDGDDSDLDFVLRNGADPNASSGMTLDNNKWTILHFAAQTERISLFEILFRGGAKLNAQDDNGDTPLHVSCLTDVTTMTQTLVELGADLNIQNRFGYTPLHYCCHTGRSFQAEVLIRAFADLKLATKSGLTVMQMAASKDDLKILELLFNFGEKPTIDLVEKANLRKTKALIAQYL
ncbi:ankyrin repeat domain-containing protein [Leptospira santarosai]|uniref:ankyrin repeat domain-containing protein n=1 Tax=Leptospira santarosai TaxID=28183 RepID=UPI0031FD8BD3